jgi:hypothetical protein
MEIIKQFAADIITTDVDKFFRPPMESEEKERRAMMTQHKIHLGSVIHGTLDQEDLLDAFAAELNRLVPGHPVVKAAYALMAEWGEGTPEEAQQLCDLVYELEDVLTELCPPFLYFGPHPGNSSDFGFWLDWESLNDAMYTEGMPIAGYIHLDNYDLWVEVNDHGNVTIFEDEDGQPGKEIYGVV